MKLTLAWLKDYLDTIASLDEIAEKLSMLGLVVDDIYNPAVELAPFKIVQVVETQPHPNADRLKICKVDTGTETVQIICGDPNVQQGMKAVLATPGTIIPATGQKLKVSKIRDIESPGMLCSATDLNLGEDSKGIIKVEAAAPIGKSYAQYKGLDDPVLDIEITPNRGDCLGAYGIARDLAASGIGKLKPLKIKPVPQQFKTALTIKIAPDTKDACPMFAGRLLKGVQNKPSPLWMQNRLQAVGLRPISALVDITNYLTYDLGRPMHVFDADKLKGNIQVRLAKAGEKIQALDEKEYKLDDGMTLVCDDQDPLSVAGVIGGMASSCTNDTINVIIESAIFDPIRTSLTGRKLNVITDSRYRFERGVDAAMVLPALEFATQFILEHCGGEASNIVVAGKEPKTSRSIAFSPNRVKSLAGLPLPKTQIATILANLGFEIKKNNDAWSVRPPSWRHDVAQEADLVEEVVRIHGYDKIESAPLPAPTESQMLENDAELLARHEWVWTTRRALTARGLTEVMTYSFLTSNHAKLFGGGKSELRLLNPISADLSDMRPSLLANLIDASRRNANRGIANAALFEVGPQYLSTAAQGEVLAASGIRTGLNIQRHWLEDSRRTDTYDAKADVLTVLKACGIDTAALQIVPEAPKWYHPGRSGTLRLGPKNVLAYFGQIHPTVLNQMDFDKTTVGFEVFLSNLPVSRKKARAALQISHFQPLERDFAFVLEASIPASRVVDAVYKTDKELITHVAVFDVYQGQGIATGYKSLAISVRLEPKKATLTEAQINEVSQKIIDQVKKVTSGELRSI